MTSLKLLTISKFVLNNLIFAESMHHRHFRDQDETVIHQIIDRYTLGHTIFLLHRPKGKSVSEIRGR